MLMGEDRAKYPSILGKTVNFGSDSSIVKGQRRQMREKNDFSLNMNLGV